MAKKKKLNSRFLTRLIVVLLAIPFLLWFFQFLGRAFPKKADIRIDTRKIAGPLFFNWKAVAQGGEEQGVRMLQNVIPHLKVLGPRYIRIDHTYDFYNVVSRDGGGGLLLNWAQLDETVCDIFATGAKPFIVLGYMPPVMSSDGSLVATPTNWNEWALLVQKTIERYSGNSSVLCGGTVTGKDLSNIYYEVWNEPDLESFGKWSLYGGAKDYKTLYYYSAAGAERAQNVNLFSLGGPATTAAYKNWMQVFLKYVAENNLRIDFISWHHYTTDPDKLAGDAEQVKMWTSQEEYKGLSRLPKIITEWGYDSNPNPIADTNVGAAYTIAAIRNLIHQELTLAFTFEAKDGPQPRWGILSHAGEKKQRYHALELLNQLEGYRLNVEGEGTYVRTIASYSPKKIVAVLVNYDNGGRNVENVPVTFFNLAPGTYNMTLRYLDGSTVPYSNLVVGGNVLHRKILMNPNAIVAVELVKQ